MYKIESYTGKNNFTRVIFFVLKISIILNGDAKKNFFVYFPHFKNEF